MKKFITILLIFCLLILCACSNFESSTTTSYTSEGMPYDAITITGPGASMDENIIISNTMEFKKGTVERIADRAFLQCDKIASVNISRVAIGANAFSECANLKTATFQYAKIGEYSFYFCENLESVTINGNSIGKGAFKSCRNLKNLIINDGSIQEEAFMHCSNLKSVTLNSYRIFSDAFFKCDNLENVTFISDNCNYIARDAFENCPKHITIKFPGTKQKFKSAAQDGLRNYPVGITVECKDGTLYY